MPTDALLNLPPWAVLGLLALLVAAAAVDQVLRRRRGDSDTHEKGTNP